MFSASSQVPFFYCLFCAPVRCSISAATVRTWIYDSYRSLTHFWYFDEMNGWLQTGMPQFNCHQEQYLSLRYKVENFSRDYPASSSIGESFPGKRMAGTWNVLTRLCLVSRKRKAGQCIIYTEKIASSLLPLLHHYHGLSSWLFRLWR
jgi:hypothetical protein